MSKEIVKEIMNMSKAAPHLPSGLELPVLNIFTFQYSCFIFIQDHILDHITSP